MRPNCAHYDEQTAKLSGYLAEGKDRDAVLALFVEEYGGQQVLAAPIDRGFNRLAWIVPYGIGAIGLFLAGVVAVRWSRRARASEALTVPARSEDTALGSRLDDELRDLD